MTTSMEENKIKRTPKLGSVHNCFTVLFEVELCHTSANNDVVGITIAGSELTVVVKPLIGLDVELTPKADD